MTPEVVFTTSHEPDPGNALDVLAFVLMPNRAFAESPDEQATVDAMLNPAKREAVANWQALQRSRR